MKNKFVVCVLSLLAAFVLAWVCVPIDNGNIAVVLAGVSCLLIIGAAFFWLRSERKRVVEEEE